ncbi:MAG: phosphomannomutase/phosphoglucomutase [Bacteroidales bacterium]|nr:phosphomannomutase/phosphoglucomutase [Bacteroidales bacterium]
MKAFKAYDIRGAYPEDINEEIAYKIGYFLPELLKTKKVLVGRDVRNSSNSLFDALSNGITDAGADVYDAGLTSTPMIYWATAKFDYSASVQITASHNPSHHNGMKVSGRNALPIGYDNGLKSIKEWIINGKSTPKIVKGQVYSFSIIEQYLEFMQKYVHPLPNYNICLDCSNGMAAEIIDKLLPTSVHYINNTRDGNFPGHDPNPLNPKNLKDLQTEVLARKADVGVIFDGDADRVMFIDENGKFISPDLIIAAMGHYFLENNNKKIKVIQDIRTSKAVGEYLAPMGAEIYMWRVGRAFAAPKLKEIDGLFGGELAGHYYFKDFYYSDSGIMACLIALKIFFKFKQKGISLSKLIKNINPYHSSGEINFRIENKKDAMDAVKSFFYSINTPVKFYDFDGYRLDYPDFWLNIRPSNTEPYLRFITEAVSIEKLNEIIESVESIMKKFE